MRRARDLSGMVVAEGGPKGGEEGAGGGEVELVLEIAERGVVESENAVVCTTASVRLRKKTERELLLHSPRCSPWWPEPGETWMICVRLRSQGSCSARFRMRRTSSALVMLHTCRPCTYVHPSASESWKMQAKS